MYSATRLLLGISSLMLLVGCAVGPDYHRPDVAIGNHFLNAPDEQEGWVMAVPKDRYGAGQWWTIFDDKVLDQLMLELHAHNPSVEQAEARYRQAVASMQNIRASLLPTLGANSSVNRSGGGGDTPTTSRYDISTRASWELDLWGRVRRGEAASAETEAQKAEFLATRLSLETALARAYFQAKNVYAAQQLMEQTIDAYEQVYRITENRFHVGMSDRSDVAAAKTQLENARTQRLALDRQAAQLHTAIAALVGKVPAELATVALSGWPNLPSMPHAVPSQLLERRPDVAAAERHMKAANARIGIAQAAWFPDITLSGQGGYSSGSWSDWLTAPMRFWSVGPALALQLFDAGARSARVRESEAVYDAQVASYRQTVLDALKEVEDNFAQWRGLSAEMQTQHAALEAARESQLLMRNQYEAGITDFLSLAQVETSTLSTERATISLLSEQYLAAVQLIAALGGGWEGELDDRPFTEEQP